MIFKSFQYFQVFSLIAAVYCFGDLKKFRLGAFLPMMILVVVTEVVAANCLGLGLKSNYGIYDGYLVIYTPLMMYIIYQMLLFQGTRRVVFWGVTLFATIFTVVNLLGYQGIKNINTYSVMLVEFMITIASLIALIKLFMDDSNDIMLHKHPYFWVNGSTILFSIGTLVTLGLQQYILKRRIMVGDVRLNNFIMPKLNYILYSGYAYAFILCKTSTSKPSSQ